MSIYLDSNATSQPLPEVTAAMTQMLNEFWGNPSSIHRFGQMARQKVELAREQVARLIGSSDKQLIFTSGGTEANNQALRGILDNPRFNGHKRFLVTSDLEHAAIREPAERLTAGTGSPCLVQCKPADQDTSGLISGLVLSECLNNILEKHQSGPLLIMVSLQWANNETGIIQPQSEYAKVINQIRGKLSERGDDSILVWHTDATQAVGKLPVDVNNMHLGTDHTAYPVDLLTLAAHKFHGPKGAGALHVRSGVPLHTIQQGGPQERERRGGTENTPAIVGMGIAAESALAFLATDRVTQIKLLRDKLEAELQALLPEIVINSQTQNRLWNTSNIAFPHLEAEAILLGLSERGIFASAGAACSSGSLEPSPVLLAMGIPEHLAHGSIRFSLCRFTTSEEIDQTIQLIPALIKRLKKTLPL